MSNLGRGGMLVTGIVLFIVGLILSLPLLDFLIDTAGLIALIVGIVLIIISIVQMVTGGNKSSASDY